MKKLTIYTRLNILINNRYLQGIFQINDLIKY